MANKTLVFSDENNKTIELATSLSAAERFAEINKKIGNGLVPEKSGTVSLGSENKQISELQDALMEATFLNEDIINSIQEQLSELQTSFAEITIPET